MTSAQTLTVELARQLRSVGLEELNRAAALQQRVDRKYVLTPDVASEMVDSLASSLAALDIEGRRSFGYRSVYFDTAELDSYLGAARGRRRRWKVRTRCYLDTSTTTLEVKTRGQRGQTIKQRRPCLLGCEDQISAEDASFIDGTVGQPGLAARLTPTLTSQYRRTTLLDRSAGVRLTLDAGLRCTDSRGATAEIADRIVVETKSPGAPSAADRWLWAHGFRPEKISKHGTGLAAIDPELPSNKWNRTLNRHFASRI